jgi:hypothetical protein
MRFGPASSYGPSAPILQLHIFSLVLPRLEWTNDVQYHFKIFQDISNVYNSALNDLAPPRHVEFAFLLRPAFEFPKHRDRASYFVDIVDRSVPEYDVEVKAHGPMALAQDHTMSEQT